MRELYYNHTLGEGKDYCLTIGTRIKKLRKYLDLSGEELGAVLGIKKNAVSMIENDNRGLSHQQIQRIVDQYKIDPRYFYGLIGSPEEADLNNNNNRAKGYDDLVNEIQELRKQVKKPEEIDPIAERVMINAKLRDLVSMVQFLDGNIIERINAVVYGYMARLREEQPDQKGEKNQKNSA